MFAKFSPGEWRVRKQNGNRPVDAVLHVNPMNVTFVRSLKEGGSAIQMVTSDLFCFDLTDEEVVDRLEQAAYDFQQGLEEDGA